MPWWWLSFADPDRPKGAQFLGAAIVQGRDIAEANQRAWTLKINPGGEVQGVIIDLIYEPAPGWGDRLMSKADVEAMPPPTKRLP